LISELRTRFNAQFSEGKYQRMLAALDETVGEPISFRTCETPVFISSSVLGQMRRAAREIISQLRTPAYHAASARAIPAEYNAPGEGEHPDFIQVDFAITKDEEGRLTPKLIELQGCASLYAFQFLLPQVILAHYDLGSPGYLCSGLSDDEYLDLFRRTVLGERPAEEVVLMEIDPENQKTRPDFLLTERMLGVPIVDISEIRKEGRRLFYRRDGRTREIGRIYNRVIVDELVRKGIAPDFDFRDELEVEWAGHPNWFFRMSKFSLPYLNHPAVPRAQFLSDVENYPEDLSRYVLKPLFSFAGSGVKVEITPRDLDAIPDAERGDYLLQERIAYAPVVRTPDDPSKVEIRLMFLWPQDAPEPIDVTTLARFSKGLMLGVDFNRNRTWVGSSCGFFRD
jgi:hypothetical protein